MSLNAESKPSRWFETPRAQAWLALAVWIVPLLVIAGMVIADPSRRTVVNVYHKAVEDWWAQQNLYAGWSYHYLPHFVVVFMPFHLLPSPVGDLLWRVVSMSLLVSGLWRLARQLFGSEAARAFLWSTLLVMPLSLGALRNGQANVVFAAFTLQAVACMSPRQWWAAAAFMALALVVKQLGIVLILLAVVVYPPLRWRVALAIAALAGLPFLFGSPAYVISQHREAF
ncbi:MAG: glycosyltransferase family 87 protein, partial [Verrucomicrobia bacterium]|nr:glycosyltransferase family 87 protein [Verrucomicrobiota bacterium]